MSFGRPLIKTTSVFMLAALVLSGCTTNDSSQDKASEQSTSTTSSSSEAGSNSAKDTSGESEPSSSSSPTEYLSGGSKAPNGEYRAADEHGPAQNVPKPERPEGIDVESPEAMVKFINYWNDLRNYAIQTGDTDELYNIVETSYEREINFHSEIEYVYESNGWYIGEPVKIHLYTDDIYTNGEGLYAVPLQIDTPKMVVVEPKSDKITGLDSQISNENTYEIVTRYKESKWSIVDIQEMK